MANELLPDYLKIDGGNQQVTVADGQANRCENRQRVVRRSRMHGLCQYQTHHPRCHDCLCTACSHPLVTRRTTLYATLSSFRVLYSTLRSSPTPRNPTCVLTLLKWTLFPFITISKLPLAQVPGSTCSATLFHVI